MALDAPRLADLATMQRYIDHHDSVACHRER